MIMRSVLAVSLGGKIRAWRLCHLYFVGDLSKCSRTGVRCRWLVVGGSIWLLGGRLWWSVWLLRGWLWHVVAWSRRWLRIRLSLGNFNLVHLENDGLWLVRFLLRGAVWLLRLRCWLRGSIRLLRGPIRLFRGSIRLLGRWLWGTVIVATIRRATWTCATAWRWSAAEKSTESTVSTSKCASMTTSTSRWSSDTWDRI